MKTKYSWCSLCLLAGCIVLTIVGNAQADANPSVSDGALSSPEVNQPLPSLSEKIDNNNVPEKQAKHLPLVSARYLDTLSATTIKKRYPHGVKVITLNATMDLKRKLNKLEKKGFSVIWLTQNDKTMRALVLKVISQPHYAGLKWFLSHIYDISGSGKHMSIPRCPDFLKTEFIPYVIRENKPLRDLTLEQLGEYSPAFYQRFLVNHYFWNDIGYSNMVVVPYRIRDWLIQSVNAVRPLNKGVLEACHASVSENVFSFVSQLITLNYLSAAVRGLYYQDHQGELPFYRKLAVESLKVH